MPIKNNSKKEEKINFVIGLGRSGFWAAKYLRSIGKRVIVWESNQNKELLETKEILEAAIQGKKMTIIVAKCQSGNIPVPVIDIDPAVIRYRFMKEVEARN